MKNPLYALLIADDPQMRLNVLTERKQISIREGHRDYQKGPMIICDPENPWAVSVNLTEVKHCTMAEITEEEWLADGFVSQEDMLEGMKKYYPNIGLSSPVTILYWNGVKGYWATTEGIEQYKTIYSLL